MKDVGFLLLIHGESTGRGVDIFDREHVFLEETMNELVPLIPGLKIVLEHITTSEAVEFVTKNSCTVFFCVFLYVCCLFLSVENFLLDFFRPGIAFSLFPVTL